jgi:superfamily II DNA or RNA helicase
MSDRTRFKGTLRPWQREFATDFGVSAKKNFLLVCLPAGGKTIAAFYAASKWLDEPSPKRRIVVYVAPLRGLKIGAKRIYKAHFGLELQTNFDGRLKEGMSGVALTYAGLAGAADAIRALCSRYEIMAIFDEPHHMSEEVNAVWGARAKHALEFAIRRLLMTGTPWRSDYGAIPFAARNDDGTYVADHLFDWPLALEEIDENGYRCIRILSFRTFDASVSYLDRDSREEFTLDSRGSLSHKQQDMWLTGAIRSDRLVEEMIREANDKLMQVRSLKPDAAGLVVCEDIPAAQRITKKLQQITGIKPHLIVSELGDDDDDETTRRDVDDFERERGTWIVSVRQVSEGVDVPRLIVGVFLTNWRTELYFRQFVGRVMRSQRTEFDKEAYIYIPNHHELVEYAKKIEELQAIAIKPKGTGDGPGPGDQEPATVLLGDSDAALRDIIVPNNNGVVDPAAVERFMTRYRSTGATERLAVQILRDGLTDKPQSQPPRHDDDTYKEAPLEDRLDDLKRLNAKRCNAWAYKLGGNDDPTMFRECVKKANAACGCRSTESATLDQLKNRLLYIAEQLASLDESKHGDP